MQFDKVTQLAEVKERIGEILDYFRQRESPLGYFAALYTKVAAAIESGVEKKEFDDNERLAKLDVNFVNYYIHAMNCAVAAEPAPAHWQLAIDAAKKPEALVLEHLFLAMNAHINYDLSNAVNDSVEPEEMIGFKPDFMRVNQILFSLLDNVQEDVARFVQPLQWYLRFGQKFDDHVISFIMKQMRTDAFGFACMLSLCQDEAQLQAENEARMSEVVQAGQKILSPPKWWMNALLIVVRLFERGTVSSKIDNLLK